MIDRQITAARKRTRRLLEERPELINSPDYADILEKVYEAELHRQGHGFFIVEMASRKLAEAKEGPTNSNSSIAGSKSVDSNEDHGSMHDMGVRRKSSL